MDTNTYSKITQKQVLEHFKNHKTLFVRGNAKQVIYAMNKKGLVSYWIGHDMDCRTNREHGAEEAVKAFHHYTNNVASDMGLVKRVIITDGGDCINAEWQYGKGITFK